MGTQFEQISLNHVALTVPRDSLDEAGRARIIEFLGGCLDFVRDPASPNVMMVHKDPGLNNRWDLGASYVVFIGADRPATATPGRGRDHVGISCSSFNQFNAFLDRTKKYLAKYGIADNLDVNSRGPATGNDQAFLHGFYVKPFDLPISFEIQFYEAAPA